MACGALVAALPLCALAQDSRITQDRGNVTFSLNGQDVTITRQGPPCPPACIQPLRAATGVVTVGELELLTFIETAVARGSGLLLDTRLPEAFEAGTVPGAVNVPATTLRPDNPYREDLLAALGARDGDFTGAYDLTMFAAGADDPQAVAAVEGLLAAGYPAGKLKYYRGGYASWVALGLSTVEPR